MDLWDFGYADVRHAIDHPEWANALEVAPGIHVYDLSPRNPMQEEHPS
jgi:NTE family protein